MAFLHSLVQRICPGPPKGHATSQRWCHCLLEMTAKEKENSHQGLIFQIRNKYLFLPCDSPPTSRLFLKHVLFYWDVVNLFSFWFPETHVLTSFQPVQAFPSCGKEGMNRWLTWSSGLPKWGWEKSWSWASTKAKMATLDLVLLIDLISVLIMTQLSLFESHNGYTSGN